MSTQDPTAKIDAWNLEQRKIAEQRQANLRKDIAGVQRQGVTTRGGLVVSEETFVSPTGAIAKNGPPLDFDEQLAAKKSEWEFQSRLEKARAAAHTKLNPPAETPEEKRTRKIAEHDERVRRAALPRT